MSKIQVTIRPRVIGVTLSPRVRTSTLLRTGATGLPGAVGAVGPQGSAGIDGIDGREVQLQKSSTHVQWRYEGETAWSNLVALSEITGPQGSQGIQGPAGSDASVTSENITTALGFSPISDAPTDGSQYARKDGAWESIQTGNPFDQSLNTTDAATFNRLVVGTELGGYVASGNHRSQIIADGSQTPLMIQGGSGAVEIWADSSPSAANSFGAAVPGTSGTSDLVFSRYFNGEWAETFRLKNDTGGAEFQGVISAPNIPNQFLSSASQIFQGFTVSEYNASEPTFVDGVLTQFTLKNGGVDGSVVHYIDYNYSDGQLTSKVLKDSSGTILNTLTFSYSGSTLTSKVLT